MSTRDVAIDFSYQPPTAATGEIFTSSIVGTPGTYLAANTIDTWPLGAYLTELSEADTILTVGGVSYLIERDEGGGNPLRLVVNWVVAPIAQTGGFRPAPAAGSVQVQLLTSAAADMSSATVLVDFGVVPIADIANGYRQIASLPKGAANQRYLGLQALTICQPSSTMVAGAYLAWLCTDIESAFLGYASAFQIK